MTSPILKRGTSTTGRDELRTVLDFLHKGDVLMVTRPPRNQTVERVHFVEYPHRPAGRYRERKPPVWAWRAEGNTVTVRPASSSQRGPDR
jgi:hypothetical protein